MNLSSIKGALPITAHLLAGQCGIKLRIGGTVARTNGREITLPDLPIESDKARIYGLGYLVHEGAGHVEHTDFDLLRRTSLPPFDYALFNAVEDVRIELAAMKRYPGAAQVLSRLREQMAADGLLREFGKESEFAGKIVIGVLEILNWRVQRRAMFEPRAAAALEWFEHTFDAAFAGSFVDTAMQVRGATNTADAIAVTQKLVDALRDYAANQPSQAESDAQTSQEDGKPEDGDTGNAADDADAQPEPEACDGSSLGDPAASDGDAPGDAGLSTESDSTDTNAHADAEGEADSDDASTAAGFPLPGEKSDGDDDDAGGPDQDGQSDQGGDTSDAGQIGNDRPPDGDGNEPSGGNGTADGGSASGDDSCESASKAAAITAALSAGYVEDPDIGSILTSVLSSLAQDADDVAVLPNALPFTDASEQNSDIVLRVKRETVALRRKLTSTLESVTETRRWNATSGAKLSGPGVLRMASGYQKVFEREIAGTSIDVAIQILIDRSCSMQHERRINLAVECCAALGMALEQIEGVKVGAAAFPAGNGLSINRDVLVLSHIGEPMRKRAGRIAAVQANGGNTPLADAMLYGEQALLAAKATRRILVPITDGVPDNCDAVHEVMGSLAKYGIEVMGVGIGMDISGLIANSTNVTEIGDLPTRMFKLMRAQLLQRKAA